MSRCQCVTAKGTQCSRTPSQGSSYCFQHQNCSNIFRGPGHVTATSTAVATKVPTAPSTTTVSKAPTLSMPAPTVSKTVAVARVPVPPPMRSVTVTKTTIPSISSTAVTSSSTSSTVRPKSPPKSSAKIPLPPMPKFSKATTVTKKTLDVPTSQEIAAIDKVIKHIIELVEEHQIEDLYIDLPSMRKFQLTMADVDEINKNPSEKYYMIEPQMWDELRQFSDDTDMFYEFNGKAVTGSGSDLWILYKKDLLDALKAIEKKYESIPRMNVAGRRAILGSEIFSKASFLLNDPEGRRARAIAATKKGYPTNAQTQSGLCNEPLSEMYKDELLQLAEDLGLDFPKNVTKAELCNMISTYADEAEARMLDIPEKVGIQEAEKMLKKARGVTDEEAYHNLDRFQRLTWSMGNKPEEAYEFVDEGNSSIFTEFPEHIVDNMNTLNSGQLDLVISNNDIVIDWINPNGDDEELKVVGPVTYRKVFDAINKSLNKFAKENDVELSDILQGHIYWEGFTRVRGKPNHYSPNFGS